MPRISLRELAGIFSTCGKCNKKSEERIKWCVSCIRVLKKSGRVVPCETDKLNPCDIHVEMCGSCYSSAVMMSNAPVVHKPGLRWNGRMTLFELAATGEKPEDQIPVLVEIVERYKLEAKKYV
jgi:hypothetical protein